MRAQPTPTILAPPARGPRALLALVLLLQAPAPQAPASAGALRAALAGQDPPAAEEEPRWTDPEDGWFDVSRFLEAPHGFLPIVVPITEPALGYGAVVGAAFLDPRESTGSEGWARPNITFVGALATEGGSAGVFAGNSSLWADGDLQTLVGGGRLALELELSGIGEDPALADDPLEYRLDVTGVVGEGRARLGRSDFWVALRFAYANAEVHFERPPGGLEGVDPGDDEVTLSGPALGLRYDSLDNLFTPTRGLLSDSVASFFDDAFGASQDFQLVRQVLIHHRPLAERWFLGARADAGLSFGDVPFYARPFVYVRGVPALRYQGEHAVSAELELRWQFHPRVSAVAFGGGGLAWTDLDEFEREESAFGQGLGLRYFLARKFGLHAGLDVARGPEENAVYVQVGNAWLRP